MGFAGITKGGVSVYYVVLEILRKFKTPSRCGQNLKRISELFVKELVVR